MKGIAGKFSSIVLWSATIGTMLLFLDLINENDAGLLTRWVKIMSMTLIGVVGIAHISKMVETPSKDFHSDYLYSITFMLVGAALLFLSILLNQNKDYGVIWNALGFIGVLSAFWSITFGASISEPERCHNKARQGDR